MVTFISGHLRARPSTETEPQFALTFFFDLCLEPVSQPMH
jgi:hypothetical protein